MKAINGGIGLFHEDAKFQIYFKTGVGGLMTGDKITKEKKKGERKTQRIDPKPEAKVEAGGRRKTKREKLQ
jgi:hypothetical protein